MQPGREREGADDHHAAGPAAAGGETAQESKSVARRQERHSQHVSKYNVMPIRRERRGVDCVTRSTKVKAHAVS